MNSIIVFLAMVYMVLNIIIGMASGVDLEEVMGTAIQQPEETGGEFLRRQVRGSVALLLFGWLVLGPALVRRAVTWLRTPKEELGDSNASADRENN